MTPSGPVGVPYLPADTPADYVPANLIYGDVSIITFRLILYTETFHLDTENHITLRLNLYTEAFNTTFRLILYTETFHKYTLIDIDSPWERSVSHTPTHTLLYD